MGEGVDQRDDCPCWAAATAIVPSQFGESRRIRCLGVGNLGNGDERLFSSPVPLLRFRHTHARRPPKNSSMYVEKAWEKSFLLKARAEGSVGRFPLKRISCRDDDHLAVPCIRLETLSPRRLGNLTGRCQSLATSSSRGGRKLGSCPGRAANRLLRDLTARGG